MAASRFFTLTLGLLLLLASIVVVVISGINYHNYRPGQVQGEHWTNKLQLGFALSAAGLAIVLIIIMFIVLAFKLEWVLFLTSFWVWIAMLSLIVFGFVAGRWANNYYRRDGQPALNAVEFAFELACIVLWHLLLSFFVWLVMRGYAKQWKHKYNAKNAPSAQTSTTAQQTTTTQY